MPTRRGPRRLSSLAAAAAAEGDGLAPPVVDAAVEDRPRIDSRRGHHARRDRGARSRLADRHDRLPAGEPVLGRLSREPVRDVAAARDIAAIALVGLADVDELDLARGEPP